MSIDIDKILAEDPQVPASEEKPQEPKDEEVVKREEQLANLNKAVSGLNEEIKNLRKIKKQLKEDDDDLPVINMEDPSARAWDKHFNTKVDPINSELEKEKEEIRTFAFQEFLQDKPALAKNPEKVKELIATYEKIRTASERTKEGVLLDLRKAYGAVFNEQLIDAARQSRVERSKEDILFSDIAVSRGATAYSEQKSTPAKLTEDDRAILAKWGMSPDEWQENKKKYG